MSAYSYQQQHPPFLLDSVSCFSQFYPPNDEQEILPSPIADVKIHDENLEQQFFSNKNSTDSSSVLQMEMLENGEQVTQLLTASIDKKKNRDSSSLTNSSLQSEDARDGEVKKQKKGTNGAMKDEEKKQSNNNKKDPKKSPEAAPKGYIHVRARRGQATDSHSLAERVRREKISERMKLLQSLVPGCDKVTGKALMLDEIINYVQSLQNQVEFLSMKLASVNPMFYNFGMDMDTFMIRTERLSSLAPPMPPVQQCSPTQATAFSDSAATFSTVNNNYPLLDTSTALLLQQGQRPGAFLQESGNLLWDVDDQRQKLFNPSGFNTNLCSFH